MGICGTKNNQRQNLYITEIRSSPTPPKINLPTQIIQVSSPRPNNSQHKAEPTPKPQTQPPVIVPVIAPTVVPQTEIIETLGLSPEQINTIGGVYQFNSKTRKDAAECIICLVPYKEKESLKALQCLHTYHQKCIDEWLTKQPICPDCRHDVR